ncbi:S-locus receptor kinase [Theobroma cacao]|nr:S-locus receptor kinase [Theobroma cacao]
MMSSSEFASLSRLLVFLCLALQYFKGTDSPEQGQSITFSKTVISAGTSSTNGTRKDREDLLTFDLASSVNGDDRDLTEANEPNEPGTPMMRDAWDLWVSNRGLTLIDPLLEEVPTHLAMRYVNIGLLCVQESADDRPTMPDVVSMLNNESMMLPSPKQPAFINARSMVNSQLEGSKPEDCSLIDVTCSALEAR